jgi:hypothetical protein
VEAAPCEQPEDDETCERLDQRVEAEADERDRRRDDARSDGDAETR